MTNKTDQLFPGDDKPASDPAGIAHLGGRARAEQLTPDERRAIAQGAADARWAKAGRDPIPRATHAGELKIGSLTIPCAVLENGERVLTQAGFLEALGRHRKANVRKEGGEARTPPILQGKAINPYISEDLLSKSRPIAFRTANGAPASGYRADLLPQVCEVYLQARDAGVLPKNQEHVAKAAEILMRGLAHVGIIALVDEATGYQDARARDALAKILENFVAKEIQRWVRTFPADFYKELFRLWKIPFTGSLKRPSFVGQLTNNIVYRRLAPGVLEEMRRRNPANSLGHRARKHHQHLTREIGHPKLLEHIAAAVALMRVSDSKDQFLELLDRALPKWVEMPLFAPQLGSNSPAPPAVAGPSAEDSHG